MPHSNTALQKVPICARQGDAGFQIASSSFLISFKRVLASFLVRRGNLAPHDDKTVATSWFYPIKIILMAD